MPSTFKQVDFTKGIQANLDSAKTPEGGYWLGINLRNRENVLSPIKKPRNLEGPPGLYQGLFAGGPYLLLISSGEAWLKDVRVAAGWQHLDGFLVDQKVPEVDALFIPISSNNWTRSGVTPKQFTQTKPQIRGSPAGALVTDGVSQPWLIQPTPSGVTAYKTQTYEQWEFDPTDGNDTFSGTKQEYVPIGRFPLLSGKKTYLVGIDEFMRRTLIFPSVSGRPLDYMINVISVDDESMAKGGTAKSTSEQVAFDDVVGMFLPSTSQGEFIVCTLNSTFLMTPKYDKDSLLFGEPTFLPVFLFQSGAVNHRSFVEVNGSVTYIGQHGINKFDAVAQVGVESNNLPFAKEIKRFFADRPQTRTCACKFEDYALYSIDSVYGPAVAVFDMTNDSWTSIDLYQGLGKIIQFAETITPTERRLFAITADNQVYEMFAHDEFETPRVYIGDMNTGDAALASNVNQFDVVFGRVYENFEVAVTHFRDQKVVNRDIRQVSSGVSLMPKEPVSVPFNNPEDGTFKALSTTVLGVDTSITVGFMVEWTTGANLSYIAADVQPAEGLSSKVSALASAKAMTKCKPRDSERYAFIADMSPTSLVKQGRCLDKMEFAYEAVIRNIVGAKIETVLGGGDYLYQPYDDTIPCYWPADIKMIFAPGEKDLDRFQEFYPRFGGKRYYRTVVSDLMDVFVLNGGWKSGEVELDDLRNPAKPSMEPDGNEIDSKQMLWLRSELALSKARWKVILIHEPPFSSSSTYWPGYSILRMPYRSWGANLIMSGHGHSYERFFVDGTTYIVAGTGGHSLSPFREQAIEGSIFQQCAFGHVELVVDAFQLSTEFVRYDGKRFDQFRIGA